MDPIQVRTLKPGTMPKASEWNAVVSKSKRWQPSQAGYDWNNGTSFRKQPNPFRKQTLFYTPVEIPAYSVFPVKVKTQGDVPFEVCEFDKTKIADYTDGYFGTNGKFKIPKETKFYGYFLDEHYDDPIAVYGNPNVGDECGLSERAEFKADPDAQGMIITGVFSTGVYYVRKMNRFPDFFATLDEDYTVEDGTYTSVTLEDPETFIGSNTIEKVYPAWNIDLGTTISGESRVIVRFDTKRGKWFFFKPGGASFPEVTVNGNQLLALTYFQGKGVFDGDLNRGYTITGKYQIIRMQSVKSMFGNTWFQYALEHPVQTPSNSTAWVIQDRTPNQTAYDYTTSQVCISALTSAEENYSNVPAFRINYQQFFEYDTITGKEYPNGAADSYSQDYFCLVPWEYSSGVKVFSYGTGLTGQRIFVGTAANNLIMNPLGEIIAMDGEIETINHNSIDVEIGTPVYSSQYRPHCILKSKIEKVNNVYSRYAFFETTETVSEITYKPDYANQVLSAGDYVNYGEYRPTATLSGSFSDSVTLRFYFQSEAKSFYFSDWFFGNYSGGNPYFDTDKIYIDKNQVFRWEVPQTFTALTATYTEDNPAEGETAATVTLSMKDLLDPSKNVETLDTGYYSGSYNRIKYQDKNWTKTALNTTSSNEIPASAMGPKEAHPDIVFTFIEKIPYDYGYSSKTYTWTDAENNSKTVVLTINKESVYIIDVPKFI